MQSDSWAERQKAIRDILATTEIRSQTDLLERLEERSFLVTQSSVSRDLAEMRVAKLEGRYVIAERLTPTPDASLPSELDELATSILRVCTAGSNLLVVHTPPGRASIVSLAIDDADWPEVVGTLAGDDTLFIATDSRREQLAVKTRLAHFIEK